MKRRKFGREYKLEAVRLVLSAAHVRAERGGEAGSSQNYAGHSDKYR